MPEDHVEEISKEWKLDPEHEFRFEVDFGTTVKLKLISGTAEIYGTEIGIGPEYEFSGRKIAVFTWHGTCSVEYVANETPMTSYLNMHLALEQRREAAKAKGEQGPRAIIVGPEDVGKTSLSKILLAYALRQSRQPIFVDLDVNEGSITMPGTLTATPINQIIDVEEGFGSSATTSPSLGSSMLPIVYYYGYPDPGENVKLYKVLTAKLAQSAKRRIAEDDDARISGMVIDTSGLIDNTGYEIIQHCVDVFDGKLYKDRSNINVLKLAKSGGVVDREKVFRRQVQMRKIREYFYGLPKFELSPCSTLINLNDITIYRVGVGSLAPSSALPIGIDRKVSETQLVKVEPDDTIRHSILALTAANSPDEQTLLESNIIGFIYVSEVDMVKQKMTILTPCPGRLPKQYLIMGSYKWMES
ncbi:Pre-mRNA cleavage complex II protein Clp1-domain-containing protein [Gigaspora rosea]|uniref:Polynucleotide 5'-hydroxyl-kinase GRC3 n=1 Tax=Gigaspora rosea TaxID=44941 RepID=A0A397VTD0_9GLOM|nr:Pre-mRNA cleavage complex II protein Clp1-domain-containing protein [Gigaspora rosea]